MAKVKVTLDTRSTSQDNTGKYPLVLRISHKSKTRDIPFHIHLLSEQYNEVTGDITGIPNRVRHSKRVQKYFHDIDLWLDENKADIKLWSIAALKDKIERKFFKKQSELHILQHAAKLFYRKSQQGKFSTISSYEDGLKMLVKYRKRLLKQDDKAIIRSLYEPDRREGFTVKQEYLAYDMPIKAFTVEFAKDFKAYMEGRFKSKNSVNIHLRSIQSILNDAASIHEELKGHKPLESIKKTSHANEPVVLTLDEINAFRQLELEEGSSFFHVRNYFLFMFNNMGMNFYDVALAKVDQFDGERFSYTRKKTEEEGDHFTITQSPENIDIITYYAQGKNPDDYLFPLIPSDTPPERIFRVKDDKANWFRKNMKKLAPLAGITKNVTTYTARDTWTNLGLQMGIDIHKVSAGLGHSSVEVTQKHYQDSVQQMILDTINKQITQGPS